MNMIDGVLYVLGSFVEVANIPRSQFWCDVI